MRRFRQRITWNCDVCIRKESCTPCRAAFALVLWLKTGGLAGFALGSNKIGNSSNTTVHVGVTIFALCFLSACWSASRLPGFLEFLIAVTSGQSSTARCLTSFCLLCRTVSCGVLRLRERHRFSTRPFVLHFIYDCYLQHWTHQSSFTRFGRKFVVHFCVVRTDIFSTPPKRCV